MDDDDNLCLCFHVSKRKVIQYIRVNKPTVASQLSECYGAGTGCGWCRPFLERLMDQAESESVELPDPQNYASDRAMYRKRKRETENR
jgi:bacterioferritin-associated ferredoxin